MIFQIYRRNSKKMSLLTRAEFWDFWKVGFFWACFFNGTVSGRWDNTGNQAKAQSGERKQGSSDRPGNSHGRKRSATRESHDHGPPTTPTHWRKETPPPEWSHRKSQRTRRNKIHQGKPKRRQGKPKRPATIQHDTWQQNRPNIYYRQQHKLQSWRTSTTQYKLCSASECERTKHPPERFYLTF